MSGLHSDFQKELITNLRKFCLETIEPFVHEDEEKEFFRKESYQGLGNYGVGGVFIPEKFQGAGLNYIEYVLVLQEIARYSVSYAVTLSVSSMIQSIILEFGNEDQKKKYIPLLSTGQEIGAFGLTESGSGSDAASLSTKAKKVKGGYEIQGRKQFISSAGLAKIYIIFARTSDEGAKGISAFIVENESPGLSFGKCEKKMGWKTSPTREVLLDHCFVPEENLLSHIGDGFKIAMSALDKGRIAIAAIATGLADRALSESIKYTLGRQQFGQNLMEFQGLQFLLAEMSTEIEASRALVESAAHQYDQKCLSSKFAAITKLKATETAMNVTTNAVQIFGGVGYTQEYPVERFMRDAKGLQIVEGTNQIQKVVIAKFLKKEYSK